MRKDYLRNIYHHDFYRKFLTVFSGTSISQAIPILFMPLLTRIFPEQVFGIYFVYASSLIILPVISTLKYELAILMAERDEDAINLTFLVTALSFVVSLGLLLIFLALRAEISLLLNEPSLMRWLPYIPLSVFLVSTFRAFTYFNNRHKQFILPAHGKVLKSSTATGFQVVSGLLGYKAGGFIFGLITGQFVSAVYIVIRTFRRFRGMIKQASLRKMINLAKQFKRIPLYNTFIALINTISNQMPVFLLTRYFGTVSAGHYGLADRIVRTPMGFIQQSVGEVFFQEATHIRNNRQDIYKYIILTYKRLIKFGIIPFILVGLFAPAIFKFIFGSNWEIAGTYTQILIPWLFVAFLNAPVSNVITILHAQDKLLMYNILLLIARFGALYLGYSMYSRIDITILFFSGVGFVFNAFLFIFILMTANKKR